MNLIKVLLVEDNPADQVMVEEVLSDVITFRYKLSTCERVQEAQDCIQEQEPDIILLDLSLPDSSGLASLEAVRSVAPNVPVVIFTGLDDWETGLAAINKGAEDYLVKGEIREGSTLERTISFALERHKLRQELHRTMEHLQRSNQKLEDFAYVVSHDLKSPLSNLRALLDIYDRELIVDENNRQVMQQIDKSVDKLGRTLASFMSILLINENLKAPSEEIALEKSLDDITRDLSQLIGEAKATVHTDFSEVPAIVFVPVLFQSILQNLLTNAIKYRSPERDPVIRIHSEAKGGFDVLHFQDNGIGIDTERHGKNLFKLFKRFNTTQAEGSGVGLYMVKSILESSGGRIEVESELGRGTLFKLYFAKVREEVVEGPVSLKGKLRN